jgi:hypothetical protein
VQTVVQAEAAVRDFRTLWVVLLHRKLFHRVLRHTEIAAVTQLPVRTTTELAVVAQVLQVPTVHRPVFYPQLVESVVNRTSLV